VLTVEKPSKLIYIAGQTPADDNYQPLHPGDLRAQYAAVLDGLTLQLKAAGATWDDVVFRRMYALDVPAFLKVLNDCTLPVPWDVNRPSPAFSSRSRSWRWWRRNGAKAGDEMRLAGSPALMRDPCHPLARGGRGFGSSGWQPGLNFAAVLSGPGTAPAPVWRRPRPASLEPEPQIDVILGLLCSTRRMAWRCWRCVPYGVDEEGREKHGCHHRALG
jgi:hypothetical protein